jgi:hypothetical protein
LRDGGEVTVEVDGDLSVSVRSVNRKEYEPGEYRAFSEFVPSN